jgi:hypothetical protein
MKRCSLLWDLRRGSIVEGCRQAGPAAAAAAAVAAAAAAVAVAAVAVGSVAVVRLLWGSAAATRDRVTLRLSCFTPSLRRRARNRLEDYEGGTTEGRNG